MEKAEIESLVSQLKAVGLEEEKIMDVFYETFKEGKMDRKDLEVLAESMGYELTDDFKEDEHADPMAKPEGEGLEGLSKEELEEAKEIKPGESKEEFEEKIEEMPKVDVEEKEEEKSEEEDKDEDEDAEWEEAQKLFK